MNNPTQPASVAAAAEFKAPASSTPNLGGSILTKEAQTTQPEIDAKIAEQKSAPAEVPNDNKDLWYDDEGKPGVGARPKSLPKKFKSHSDLAKSYTELEKKMGSFKSAPENYDLKFVENVAKETGFKLEPEHPDMKAFLDFAKKSNASQEVVETLLNQYAQMQVRMVPNAREEFKKLGDAGPVIQKRLEQWLSNKLTPEEYARARESITTADMALIFDKLRANTTINPVEPPSSAFASVPNTIVTPNQVQMEIESNMSRYQKDVKYRKEMFAKLQQAIENTQITSE